MTFDSALSFDDVLRVGTREGGAEAEEEDEEEVWGGKRRRRWRRGEG